MSISQAARPKYDLFAYLIHTKFIFSTTLIATGVNIRGATDLYIDSESVYMMTSELYWQLVGRIGRYEDSTVHLFSYIDDSGNVLRN